jgi:fused signal recognition particle receptor
MSLFDNLNFSKLKDGLSKTKKKIYNSISETVSGRAVVDNSTLDEIEEILITADIGSATAERIIENTRIRLKSEKERSNVNIMETVKTELISVVEAIGKQNNIDEDLKKYKPYVILIVGVNGSGKTTTVGKLAYNFKQAGLKVLVGAADTFRAAANEQLDIWAKRAGVEIIQKKKGSDPSSVAFEAVSYARENQFDIVIIDTAGRLHSKINLMEELNKIHRVISKQLQYAPNETLLVLDGTTGQNAVYQAEEFSKAADINGIVVTKLDGTAKGGVIFQICSEKKIPVKYIGVGEGIEDLQTFDPKLFISAIFDN